MTRVLVTGGTGFVGSHLVDLLRKKGYDVTCLVRDPERLQWLSGEDVQLVKGDCCRPESLIAAVNGCSVVYHVAGLTKAKHNREFYTVNHLGTRNVLEACANNKGIKKFVLVSSLAAAGPGPDNGRPITAEDAPRPITDYGKSKLLAEDETLRYKDIFPVVIIRPSAVYGPRDRDMFELFRGAARGLTIEITGGERYINPCYVEDLAGVLCLAAEKQVKSGSIYFAAENRSYSWSEFKTALLTTGGITAQTVRVPYLAAYLIGFIAEAGSLLTSRPSIINRQKVLEAKQKYWTCDIGKTERELGFKSRYPLQNGLEITWRWYRDNHWLN